MPTVKPVTFYLTKVDGGYHNADILLCFEDPDDPEMYYCADVDHNKIITDGYRVSGPWTRQMASQLTFIEPTEQARAQSVTAQPEVTTDETPSA